MSRTNKRVLVLTNSEFGAANNCLAVVHELLQIDPTLHIETASFHPIAATAEAAAEYAVRCAPKGVEARRPIFRELSGLSRTQALVKKEPQLWQYMGQRLTPWNAPGFVRRTGSFFLPWSAEGWVSIYRELEAIVRDFAPDYAVVDQMFGPGVTICRSREIPHILCVPNTLKEVALSVQPNGQALWKYPIFASGFAYPVPWYLIPFNIYYILCFIIFSILDSRYSRIVNEIEKTLGSGVKVVTARDYIGSRPPGLRMVVGSRREVDFPVSAIPEDVIPCGPIIRPAAPIQEADPELAEWLSRGPTVFINLGTLKEWDEVDAADMALTIKGLFEHSAALSTGVDPASMRRLQILWKLKKHSRYEETPGLGPADILKEQILEDRVRTVDWVSAEPISVLQSGNVVCHVNHGGANSFNEAIVAGIPQVVLPVWADAYEYARRVEWLGVGRWGSEISAPSFKCDELGPILIDVILGPHASRYQNKAKELADICDTYGDGRRIAAQVIFNDMKARLTQ